MRSVRFWDWVRFVIIYLNKQDSKSPPELKWHLAQKRKSAALRPGSDCLRYVGTDGGDVQEVPGDRTQARPALATLFRRFRFRFLAYPGHRHGWGLQESGQDGIELSFGNFRGVHDFSIRRAQTSSQGGKLVAKSLRRGFF